MGTWILIIIGVVVLLFVRSFFRPSIPPVNLGNWSHYHEGLSLSGLEFFTDLKAALKEREFPSIHLSEVSFRERTVLSAQRKYLRIEFREFVFDLYCAPYAKGTYFSWWLGKDYGLLASIISRIPFIGTFLVNAIYPMTYHHLDSAQMFRMGVHTTLMRLIDDITTEKGVRQVSTADRQPVSPAIAEILK